MDTFIAKIHEASGSLKITIPTRLCKFAGLNKGDLLKIIIKKEQEETK